MSVRVGFSYDIHRLVEGRPLRLACVEIPFGRGLLGFSDGDVAAHAAADALLSAAGLGDIGTHFPAGHPRWAGAAGALILSETRRLLEGQGLRPRQVDLTILAEAPRVAPHREAMRRSLAAALAIEVDAVTVKGRSHEGLGEIGRGEAIAAYAVALVEPLVP